MLYVIFTETETLHCFTSVAKNLAFRLVNYNNYIEPIGWLSIQSNRFCFKAFLSFSFPLRSLLLEVSYNHFLFSFGRLLSQFNIAKTLKGPKSVDWRQIQEQAPIHELGSSPLTLRLVSKGYAPTLTLPPQYCIFPPCSHKGILLPKTKKDQGKHSKQKRLRTHLQSQKPN